MPKSDGTASPAVYLVSYEFRTDGKPTSESRRVLVLNGDARRASKIVFAALKERIKSGAFEFRITGIQHVTDVEMLDSNEK